MSTTQQQKKKLKKTYEELVRELSTVGKNTLAVYVPAMCEALRNENPEMSNTEIRTRVKIDIVGNGYVETSVYQFFPSWTEDNPQSRGTKKAWETRNANKLAEASKKLAQVSTTTIAEPPQPKQRDVSEEVDQQMHELGIAKFGDTDKSIRELKGDITEAAAQLFKALTQKDMPDESDDLIVDYIKPTREFRRSLSLELDETARTTIYNWLHYTRAAIEDMMQIISEVKDK